MDKNLECPQCSDIYGDSIDSEKSPRCLACGDTICKKCLQELIDISNGEFLECPLCKEKIKKEEDINNYIPNKAIISSVNDCFNLPKSENVSINGEKIISYNIILLGNTGVGKSSIFSRLKYNTYKETFISTMGMDITTYFLKYKNQKYYLNIQDTAGQERYKSITKKYLKGKDGVLFIFDISDQKTFDEIESWYELYKNENKEIIGLLIGNKCDLERKVNEEAIEHLSKKLGLEYIETSAKLNKRVRKIIISLLNKINKSKETKKPDDNLDKEDKLAKSYFSLYSDYAESKVKTKSKSKKKKWC